jgi:hypothetical protein
MTPPDVTWRRALSTSAPRACSSLASGRDLAQGVVDERPEGLQQPGSVSTHPEAVGGLATHERDPGQLRRRTETGQDGAQDLVDVERLEVERQMAGLREACGPQIIDDPAEQLGLLTDGPKVAIVVLVDAIEDGRRRRIDDGQRCLQLVGCVLEHPPTQRIRPVQRPGHAIEGPSQLADLVSARRQSRTSGEVAGRDGCRSLAQGTEGSDEPSRDDEPERRGTDRRDRRDGDDGQRGLLLDTPGRLASARTGTEALAASMRCAAGQLRTFEAAPHDGGCQDGDRGGRRDRHEREGQGELDAKAHRRAARYPSPRTVST